MDNFLKTAAFVQGRLAASDGCTVCTALGLVALLAIIVFIKRADADLTASFFSWLLPSNSGFRGKTVLLVGASSGIGEALAYELARRGATLILAARRMDRLVSVAEKCVKLGAADARAIRLDVEDTASHKAIIDGLMKDGKTSRIDYLVNNSGRSQRALFESTSLEVDKQLFNLNVFGIINLTRCVLPYMLQQGSGHIINTSSIAGKTGSPISSSYAGTKHAIQGYFNSLRMEVAYRGISVTNVIPGPVQSEITLHAMTDTPGQKLGQTTQEDAATRVTAERCAELMTTAMYYDLPEVWIAKQPFLLFTYVGQYLPWLYFKLGRGVGKKRVEGFKKGVTGYTSISSWGSIFSSGAGKGKEGEQKKGQ